MMTSSSDFHVCNVVTARYEGNHHMARVAGDLESRKLISLVDFPHSERSIH